MFSMLQTLGHRLEEASNDRSAVRMLTNAQAHLVLVGDDPANAEEASETLEFLAYLRRKHPGVPVIVFSSDPKPDRTREILQQGASSVLRFPMPATQLRAAVAQALPIPEPTPAPPRHDPAFHGPSHAEARWAEPPLGTLRNGNGQAQAQGTLPSDPSTQGRSEPAFGLLGEDPVLRQAVELAEAIAPTRAPVLIVGEPGTGKSMLARGLHRKSPRAQGPFLEFTCASFKESALELELFGRRGSGPADPDRIGRIGQAHGGTLFIDDIPSLPPALQYKLLRVLRDGEFEPIGASQPTQVDCRIIVGSTEDLTPLVESDLFRHDLFYALSVVTLKLPPLRQRGVDIIRLAEYFRDRFAREAGKPITGFTPDALDLLRNHVWPGNVQELRRTVERAVVVSRGPAIDASQLTIGARPPHALRPSTPSRAVLARDILPLKEALEEPEKQLILQALQALNWNRQETARVLDINRTTLYKKMKKYGLLYDEPVWVN